MSKKLDAGQKNILQLIAKEADRDGWAKVSAAVGKAMHIMPTELVIYEADGPDEGGRVRLTANGRSVLYAMQWL